MTRSNPETATAAPPPWLAALVLLGLLTGLTAGQDRAADLLGRMSLAEKAGQMTQLTLAAVSAVKGTPDRAHELDRAGLEHAIVGRHVGSLLNTCEVAFDVGHWHEVLRAVQDLATKKSRLRIPVLYGVDAVHGANYTRGAVLFPQSIGMAATWSPELVRRAAEVTAHDVRASGIPWNFAPVVDLGRTPLWSRFFETYGEDVHLASVMGAAAVRGLQGDGVGGRRRVAACLKHFVGYGFPLSGKDRTPAWIPERELRERFLPPFQAALAAGARTVMVNSGEVNGIPVHSSRWLLHDVLRGELGFQGVVVTDWEDVSKLHEMHRVAPTYEDAVLMAVEAGIDLCMVPHDFSFTDALIALVEAGRLPEARLDRSVLRILRLKDELGLFERPYPDPALAAGVGDEDGRALSLEAARESITLLKNDAGVLPLASGLRVLVTGPGATSLPMLHGAWTWTWQGRDPAAYPAGVPTVLEGLRDRLGPDRVLHVPGGTVDAPGDLAAVRAAAGKADVILVAVGEEPAVEKPGDIEDLRLSPAQIELVEAAQETGKPVIMLLLQGRPRLVSDVVQGCAAVLTAYLPGPFGARAVAEVVAGDVDPGGRLPFTYPRHAASLVPYDHKESARFDREFGTAAFQPQFAFGHGLSYTTFGYRDLKLDRDRLGPGSTLGISVTVANEGKRPGKEVVMLFVRDDYASVTPPVQRLRGFEKIELAPGRSRVVSFRLTQEDLAFVGRDLRWVTEPGTFEVRVGGLTAPFTFVDTR